MSRNKKLSRIEQPQLVDRVYERLLESILSGELTPGERLIEMHIAQDLGSSRGPVREAMARLEKEGLIESRARKGASVTTLDEKDVWEVYTLRTALEKLAFRLAPSNVTPAKREELQQLIDGMRDLCVEGNIKDLTALGIQFHEQIVRLAQHERLLSAWMSLIKQIHILSESIITSYYDNADDWERVPDRHQRLLEVLCSGTVSEREREIEEHIELAAKRVLSQFEQEDEEHDL